MTTNIRIPAGNDLPLGFKLSAIEQDGSIVNVNAEDINHLTVKYGTGRESEATILPYTTEGNVVYVTIQQEAVRLYHTYSFWISGEFHGRDISINYANLVSIIEFNRTSDFDTYVIEVSQVIDGGVFIGARNYDDQIETLIAEIFAPYAEAEAERVANEEARQEAEESRETAENLRDEAEDAREDAEDARVAAETARATAESDRVIAENMRDLAEENRVESEQTRENSETARAAAELERVSDESARIIAESGRVSAENSRATAESGRVSAETSRVSAESGRVSAESSRATAEAGRVSAETSRVSAESARATAEAGRVSAEVARESASAAAVTAANTAADYAELQGDYAKEQGEAAAEIADAKADKVPTAPANNIVVFDNTGNIKNGGVGIGQVAKIDGSYKQMNVGTADNLVDTKGNGTEQVFTDRPTAGTDSVQDDGTATIKKIMGYTLKWNQIFNIETQTKNGVTITNNGNGSYTLNGTATADIDLYVRVEGKAYIKFNGAIDNGVGIYRSATGTIYTDLNIIVSMMGTVDLIIRSGTVLDNHNVYINIHNLTYMFGAGKEPSTPEEFKALYPNAYYAHNAGTLINNTVTAIKTDGFNQWDEQWELGAYDTNGVKMVSTAHIRNTNPIKVYPNKEYYFKTSNKTLFVYWYDSDMKLIEGTRSTIDMIRQSPINAQYLNFYAYQQTTYNHDICINLSHSGYRNGEYEPYWEQTKQLPSHSEFDVTYTGADGQQHVESGRKSAGSAYDEEEIILRNGVYYKRNTQRIIVVDLGAQNWSYITSAGTNNFFRSPNNPSNANFNYRDNIFCSLYQSVDKRYDVLLNKEISLGKQNEYRGILIVDNSYTDVVSFKAAMAGVLLYYELETPIVTEEVLEGNPFYSNADFGTESIEPQGVNEQGVPLSTPFRSVIKYSDDFTRQIVNMPKNYQSQESMDAMLTAMGSTLGFTFTKTWDSTNGKWTYTITKTTNNE